ncbi:MAG: hypothetical protein ACREBT_05490, partial [Thermoplasmata archaeon]
MSRAWAIATFFLIACLFGLVSMLVGGMLVFAHTGVSGIEVLILTSGTPWWTYPGILIEFPNGVIALPFLATIAMVLVSAGVGLGMTVAIFLWSRLIALRRTPSAQSIALSSAAGLTPAFLAIATIGACCSITASTATGLGVVSTAGGTNPFALLANNWYLWVFQLVVLSVALIAHEALLQSYGPMLGIPRGDRISGDDALSSKDGATVQLPPVPLGRSAVAVLGRLALLVGGLTWGLAGVALFVNYGYPTASGSFWFAFLIEYELVAVVATYLALFPEGARSALLALFSQRRGWSLRLPLLIAGISMIGWLPPTLLGTGAGGFMNELLGFAGLPFSVGAI